MATTMSSTRKLTESLQQEIMSKLAIKKKTKDFLADRKHANNLIDIISVLENDDTCADTITTCIQSISKIFTRAITEQDMFFDKNPESDVEVSDLSKSEIWKMWMRERYTIVKNRLLLCLHHDQPRIQELALCTLMKFVKTEGHHPLRKLPSNDPSFPAAEFQPLLVEMLSSCENCTTLLARFQEYLEYDDVRFYTMKHAVKFLKARDNKSISDQFLNNMYSLMTVVSMPAKPPEEEHLTNCLCKVPEKTTGTPCSVVDYKEHRKLFTSMWLEFLKCRLSVSLYKKILVVLHEKVMPHMTSPLLLCDFLTESYNVGGAISLLALNGLFILVNNYNLNYPDFYEKLYVLLEPNVFHAKYCSRFFFLLDLFLTSSHLPSYLVGSFAKKLSRLALTAPPNVLLVVIPFIRNLLTRHPTVEYLVHRPGRVSDVAADPFLMEEKNPSKCKATESCLWEIKSLEDHYHHSVATEAKKIEQKSSSQEIDLSSRLETTADKLMDKEISRKFKEVPTTFKRPKKLLSGEQDVLLSFWTT